jgi:hypothetical protein
MPPPPSDFDQQMQRLEAEIRRLEAEYNMFFAGRLPRLPWETRARVDALVKRFDRMSFANTAERFRFGTLQARYTKFCELWERSLRAREEGRPQRGGARLASAQQPPAQPPGRSAAGESVIHVSKLRDPKQDSERMLELYEHLSEARKKSGEDPVPYHRFAQVVRAQITKLGAGDTDVAFRVAVKDGKVTLTAKAVKD